MTPKSIIGKEGFGAVRTFEVSFDVMLENMVGQRVFVNQLTSRLLLFAKFAAEKQALFDFFSITRVLWREDSYRNAKHRPSCIHECLK